MKRQSITDWVEEANKRHERGENRKAAALLLRVYRKYFFTENDLVAASRYLQDAMNLLKPEEVTDRMRSRRFLLNMLHGSLISAADYDRVNQNETYFYLILWQNFRENDAEKGIQMYRKRWQADQNRVMSLGPGIGRRTLRIYNFCSLYFYSHLLELKGENDRAIKLIHFLIEKLKNKPGMMHQILNAHCFSTLGSYYQKKNQNVLSENFFLKAFQIAENYKIYAWTSEIYFELASFYSTIYGAGKSSEIANRALDVSKRFTVGPQLLAPLYRMSYNAMYAGEVKEFWEYLNQLKSLSIEYRQDDSLALAHILEGNFHMYNKDFDKAEDDYRQGLPIAKTTSTANRIQRNRVLLRLFSGKYAVLEKYIEENPFDFEEYGFNLVLDILRANTTEEIGTAFRRFSDNSALWREEVALSFYEKIGRAYPILFENYCKELIESFSKSQDDLSLAISYEALARFYQVLGRVDNYQQYLGKAVTILKKVGMDHAVTVLSQLLLNETSEFKIIQMKVQRYIQSSEDEPLKSDFLRYKGSCDQNLEELDTYRDIMIFIRSIETHCGSAQILRQLLRSIGNFFRLETGFIAAVQKGHLEENFWYGKEFSSPPMTSEEILKLSATMTQSPFSIKAEYFIEPGQSVILFFRHSKRIRSKIVRNLNFFLNEIEPILSLMVRSSMSYGKSVQDALTLLNSRWFYEQRLQEEFEKSSRYRFPISYIMADIDDFKKVNDTFGHPIGDEVLRKIGSIIREHTRKFDISARYGGEEFAIVLPNTAPKQAFLVAEKIRRQVEKMKEFPFRITLSFGVSGTGHKKYEKPEELVKDGDIALYEAKKAGKNQTKIFFYDE